MQREWNGNRQEENLSPRAGFSSGRRNSWFKHIIEKYVNSKVSVCDFGCGESPFYAALMDSGKELSSYLGIDNDAKALEHARRAITKHEGELKRILDDCALSQADNPKLFGHAQKRYDYILLHHVIHDIDPLDALPLIFKLLKPKGKILIGDMCGFVTYHGGGVPFDCNMLRTLFTPEYFTVNCGESEYNAGGIQNVGLSAVVAMKTDGHYPDVPTLSSHLKDLYDLMIIECQAVSEKHQGEHREETPKQAMDIATVEIAIRMRLDKLKALPPFALKKSVDRIIGGIKKEFDEWLEKLYYISQDGRHDKLDPISFLEVTWQREREKAKAGENPSLHDIKGKELETFRSGPILEAIQAPENRQLVLLGDPGMGKTTTLEYLKYAYALSFGEHKTLPIFIELKYYGGSDWLKKEIIRILGNTDIETLNEYYTPFILLDGYNEVRGEHLYIQLEEEVRNLLALGMWVIITSRKFRYPTLKNFSTCEISPLSDTKIKEFLGKALRQESKAVEKEFSIIRDKRLLRIARVPLFLDFISNQIKKNGKLPSSKGGLLQLMIEEKMASHEERKTHKVEVPFAVMKSLMFAFCYQNYKERESIVFTEDSLISYIEISGLVDMDRYDPHKIIYEIKKRGLASGRSYLSFFHQTVFEFFAARHMKLTFEALDSLEKRLGYFIEHFNYKKWDDILSIFFDLIGKKYRKELSDFFSIESIGKSKESAYLMIDFSIIASNPETCTELLKHHDEAVRAYAVETLGKIAPEKFIEHLIPLLRNDDSWVSSNVAAVLGNIGSERAIEYLISILRNAKNSFLFSLSAAKAFEKVEADKALGRLIPLLRDESKFVRLGAVIALGSIGSNRAIEYLIPLLRDKDLDVRKHALCSIGKIGNERAVGYIIPYLKDEDSKVRQHAAEALGETKSELAFEHLIPILKDCDIHVCYAASRALGKMGTEKMGEHLIPYLKDEDSKVRQHAAIVLGRIGSNKAIKYLISLLNRWNSECSAAAYALGEIKAESAVEHLIPLLRYKQSNTLLALGKIGSKRAIEHLVPYLKDEDSGVRISAAEALGETKSELAAECIIPLLRDKDRFVRLCVIKPLGKIGSERAVEHLIPFLRHYDNMVSCAAVEALINIAITLPITRSMEIIDVIKDNGRFDIFIYKYLSLIKFRYIPEHLLQKVGRINKL